MEKIEIKKMERDCDWNRNVHNGSRPGKRIIYDWAIIINGEQRGFWRVSSADGRNGYNLADADGVLIQRPSAADPKKLIIIKIPSQAEFAYCTKTLLDDGYIPDQAQLVARRSARAREREEHDACVAKQQRKERIRYAANDTYSACKKALAALSTGKIAVLDKILQHAVDVAEGRAEAKEPTQ